MSASGRLKEPAAAQALRIATISAWAVGSLPAVTWFQPSAMIRPSRTITAPNGPVPSCRIFSSDSAIARCMNSCWLIGPMSQQEFMQRAIALSLEKMRQDGTGPFGAVIVRDGRIIAEGWNQVTAGNDPTAHAEIVAIRKACAAAGSFNLPDADIYTSC